MKYLYDPNNEELMKMMPQAGVKQYVFPDPILHNASWDSFLDKDGKLYFSLCSELTTSEYAKLMEYNYDDNSVKEHLYAKDVILPKYRQIRDSKFHTSICQRNDGSLIMATHTTDKSPCHPAWLPEAYYNNVYEGFPGSSLINYYPETGKIDYLGIPAIRESLYGGIYDKVNDCFYALGFMRGHLYKYDFRKKEAEDLGQVSEKSTYRLAVGSDDNIYFSTRSGVLKRIDVKENKVENLNIDLPNSCEKKHLARSYMCSAANGPDGKLYIALQFHDELVAYDPKDEKLVNCGRFMEEDEFMEDGSNNAYIGAMNFDDEGVLWYLICCLKHNRQEDYKPACVLMRWDVINGGKPERIGLAGTARRAITTSVGLHIDKTRKIMYLVSTNHADDGIDITAIDLETFRKHLDEERVDPEDRYIYPDNGLKQEYNAGLMNTWKVIDSNSAVARFKKVIPVRIWRKYDGVKIDDIAFDNDVLHVYLDNGKLLSVDTDGKIVDEKEYGELERFENKCETFDDLPYVPGRQYLATADKVIEIGDEKLCSTKDGYLSVVKKNGDVFALGMPGFSGPVHDMCVTKDNIVYGVAGDDEDLGMIFTYDGHRGLRLMGRLVCDGYEYGIAASNNLFRIIYDAISDTLAIAAKDDLSCVYLCKI